MTLIKTSLLNAIAVTVKMLTLLAINKLLAIYVGPAGYAAIGQFQNAIQMITTVASGAINTGVVKYTAEYSQDVNQQRAVWRTAGTLAFSGSVVTALTVAICSEPLADWFFKDHRFRSVFLWFAATLAFFVFNSLLLAILNGKKEIHRYVLANIAGSLFALVVTTVMAIKLGLYGALVALAVFQSLTFFVTLILCVNASWFKLSYLFGKVHWNTVQKLGKYALMALVSGSCVPVSHILIRNHLGDVLGWEAAGYWEAMWRLSAAYLMLVTTTLGLYYLPKFSELNGAKEIKREVLQGYKVILPVAVFCGFAIYVFRHSIIDLLFSSEFRPMESLFAWQLVGDTLKIGSWILSYIMLGKAMVKLFVISEITFAVSFYVLTVILTETLKLEGAAVAYAVNYFVYWAVMAFFISRFIASR